MSFNPRKALEVTKRGLAEKPSGSMVIFILAILGSNTEEEFKPVLHSHIPIQ